MAKQVCGVLSYLVTLLSLSLCFPFPLAIPNTTPLKKILLPYSAVWNFALSLTHPPDFLWLYFSCLVIHLSRTLSFHSLVPTAFCLSLSFTPPQCYLSRSVIYELQKVFVPLHCAVPLRAIVKTRRERQLKQTHSEMTIVHINLMM